MFYVGANSGTTPASEGKGSDRAESRLSSKYDVSAGDSTEFGPDATFTADAISNTTSPVPVRQQTPKATDSTFYSDHKQHEMAWIESNAKRREKAALSFLQNYQLKIGENLSDYLAHKLVNDFSSWSERLVHLPQEIRGKMIEELLLAEKALDVTKAMCARARERLQQGQFILCKQVYSRSHTPLLSVLANPH